MIAPKIYGFVAVSIPVNSIHNKRNSVADHDSESDRSFVGRIGILILRRDSFNTIDVTLIRLNRIVGEGVKRIWNSGNGIELLRRREAAINHMTVLTLLLIIEPS